MNIVLFNLSISLVKTLQQAKQRNLVVAPVDLFKVVDELGVGLEVPRDQRRMDIGSLSFTSVDNAI